jgi:hypothetical protein
MASIGWIDFSPSHRDRVATILELLKPEGMVDELGIGIIRDAIADQLFPGINTIQTRAKYFFIIPYILFDYLKLKPTQRQAETAYKYLEKREFEIMWKLAEKYNHEEGQGVIGITKRKPEKIIRRPSTIYWNGLRTFNFINTNGLGMPTFLKQASNLSLESLLSVKLGDDSPGDDEDAEFENPFKLKIAYNPDWTNDLDLDLTEQEASIFYDKIIDTSKEKLIGILLGNHQLYKVFKACDGFIDFAKTAVSYDIPNSLRSVLILAHDFSELLFGAHITYNCILQKAAFSNELYESQWQKWLSRIEKSMIDYEQFNPNDLFSRAMTTPGFTRQFIYEWWNFIKAGGTNITFRNQLVEKQESKNKKYKARINMKKYEDAKEEGWLGLRFLDYRYQNAKVILNDIKAKLN